MAKVDMTMPQMGESIQEGTIVKWLKKEGDKVEQDEMILEISTDKVDSEIPSPHSGVLKKILAKEGEDIEVGAKIAEIETDGDGAQEQTKAEVEEKEKEEKEKGEEKEEEVEARKKEEEKEARKKEEEKAKQGEEKTKQEKEEKRRKEEAEKEKREEEAEAKEKREAEEKEEEAEVKPRKRKFYSPLVRSIAKAEDISEKELEQIEGSGSNGRVTKQDLLDYIKKREEAPAEKEEIKERKPAAIPEIEPEYSDERKDIIPMDNMRKSIAKHMVRSVQTSPHVFAVSEADMTNLVRFRKEHKEEFQNKAGVKLTYMPFIIQACTKALLDFPLVNSSVEEDKIIRKKYINIGVAVALENNGLIVPVIKDADGMNIIGLARKANDLAQRARSKQLKPDEVQDGTFSITNMGSFGSIMGLPIINQPQLAILGVGVIQKRPVVRNDAIAIRDMMYISLSFDHRIVDGAMAGQFLDQIAQNLTNFDTSEIL